MTTAERALELAEKLAMRALSPFGWEEQEEAESILRHYAEILPKYEAIMAAEPVAWHSPDSTNEDYAFSFQPGGSWSIPLIIKP